MPDGRLATLDFDVLLRNEEQFLMAAEKAVADWCSDALERAQARRAQRGAAQRGAACMHGVPGILRKGWWGVPIQAVGRYMKRAAACLRARVC